MKHDKFNPTWGGRFSKSLNPIVTTFLASIQFDQRLYKFDIIGSQIHALMLGKQKIISEKESQVICEGLEKVKYLIEGSPDCFNHQLEDIHMNIEFLLEKEIGEIAKKLHTGRSRNDQVALDLRLFTREAIDEILLKLSIVDTTLEKLIILHDKVLLPGYTHLQRAQPITLSEYFDAYRCMFKRDKERLEECFKRLNYSPLGAGALAGSGLPLARHDCAKQLGFAGIIENCLDAVSDRDFIIEFCSVASILMMHLSRLCEDIIIYSTDEFAFITLDDAFSTGSSLMPNKRNPDIAELIRGKSGRVFGHLMAMLTVMKALPLSYNKDMQEDKELLFDTVDTLTACLTILPSFLESLSFNQKRMLQAVEDSYMDATSWVEKLVLKGIPFRVAHEIVGHWVAQAMLEEKKIVDYAEVFLKEN